MKKSTRKVPSACERCRKQKLKCDIERPCTLCARADKPCITSEAEIWRPTWRPYGRSLEENPAGSGSGSAEPFVKRRRLDRVRGTAAPVSTHRGTSSSTPEVILSSPVREGHNDAESDDLTAHAPWNASSTVTLVEEVFHHHEIPSPREAETSALLATTWAHSKPSPRANRHPERPANSLQRILSQITQPSRNTYRSRSALITTQNLLPLLPDSEPAMMLVDNYFDRIHWFTLIFHQRDFRDDLHKLYGQGPRPSDGMAQTSKPGYIAVLAAVLATSLAYTSIEQKRKLEFQGIETEQLKTKLLTGLKYNFLDIVSLGSLGVVQMCVLLGSYYLYHGEPEMAWPLCGSGLRIAQALNLHRKLPSDDSTDKSLRHSIEDRKRAWWAIYEIETFCSMLYGFPLSINDSDCDVPRLDPLDEYSDSVSAETGVATTNLLHFKCTMSTLSTIVKSALDDLYGTRRSRGQNGLNQASRLNTLVHKVASLNLRLLLWKQKLPSKFTLDGAADQRFLGDQEANTPKTGESGFEDHLFRLQALSLKLAYENARILIHRPLLSFRSRTLSSSGDDSIHRDPFQTAIHTCREAALQISQVQLTKNLREATETYAMAFVSLHLLTAAATLCISVTLDPLSLKAYESKMGIRRLMQIQMSLKDKSSIAAQGLDITKRLMALVMTKEAEAMFEVELPTEQMAMPKPQDAGQSHHANKDSAEILAEQPEGQSAAPASQNPGPAPNFSDDPTLALGTEFDFQSFEFCENTFMTEAVSQYEQAIHNPMTGNSSDQADFLDQQDPFFGTTSLGQEQGWIWGWDFLG